MRHKARKPGLGCKTTLKSPTEPEGLEIEDKELFYILNNEQQNYKDVQADYDLRLCSLERL